MNKKFFIVLLSLLISLTATGCDATETETETESVTLREDETKELLSQSFSSTAFFDHGEGDAALTDEEIQSVLANIPTDQYEAYPDTHTVPVSATLYKNGEAISIDARDPRLIGLINLFNNSVYYEKCAYTQGLLPLQDLEESILHNDFRLELTYTPYGTEGPSPYGTCTTGCDTIVITNTRSFTLIAHDLPGYEGEEAEYPFQAVDFSPLYQSYPWLELFGF